MGFMIRLGEKLVCFDWTYAAASPTGKLRRKEEWEIGSSGRRWKLTAPVNHMHARHTHRVNRFFDEIWSVPQAESWSIMRASTPTSTPKNRFLTCHHWHRMITYHGKKIVQDCTEVRTTCNTCHSGDDEGQRGEDNTWNMAKLWEECLHRQASWIYKYQGKQ